MRASGVAEVTHLGAHRAERGAPAYGAMSSSMDESQSASNLVFLASSSDPIANRSPSGDPTMMSAL